MWHIIALILFILIAATLIKVFLSKNIFEKLVALDATNILTIALLIVFSIIFKQLFLADMAIAYALLSFIGILYFTKYYQDYNPR